jgi:cellulose synthase/poly-beta-1,6-N-acetylglucosamine synthase-like glycosyltransferase
MPLFWQLAAAINFGVVAAVSLFLIRGGRRVGRLADVPSDSSEQCPAVSIIVAARNEERHLQSGLKSLLQMDYVDYQVIVVNDRSEDDTGGILERMSHNQPRLTVLQVDELPDGWLGKNHALQFGAERADGEYLLFTDADVVMQPGVLRQAVAHMVLNQVDHLAVTPRAIMPSQFLSAFVVLFMNLFALYTRPWKVSDPRSSAFIGIGAFNMIRSDAYHAIGMHRLIAMRPDDDVKLGKVVKAHGFKQSVLYGTEMISVPWYTSVRDLIQGLEKNAFSGVDYRVSVVVALTLALTVFDLFPFVALFLTRGVPWLLYLATVLVLLGHAWLTARDTKLSRWSVVYFPLTVLLIIFIQWRAMILTYLRNGIRWRDTHYPLAQLRANKV